MKKFTILVIFSHLLLAFMALGLTLVSCEAPSNNRSNDETIEMVTVRFNANGGSGATPAARTVEAGSRITLPDGDGLTRSGYAFGGWNTKRDGTGINYSAGSSYTVTGDITLYAKWNVVSAGSFTVTFNSNGGSSVEVQIVSSGGRATRPIDPAMSGYTFDNWYRDESLTTVYNFGAPVTGNITLYAKWDVVSAGSFTVVFYSNGGSSVTTQTVNSGGTATRPIDPTRNNDTFDNWYSDWGLTTVYNFSTPVTGHIILYAKWTPVVIYIVTFNSNGATSGTVPSTRTVAAGSSITLPGGSGLTRNGYAFGGWNTRADGEGTNHSADSSYTVQNDITLYAEWISVPPGSFTVTFDSNGGSSVNMEIVQSGGTATRPANPTKSGYTFGNWYSNTGLTAVYNFSTPVMENIILYARWDINQYTVTFNANGGTSAPVPQTIDHGDMVNEPAAITKANYTFGGWFKETAFINQWNFSSDTVTDDTTLYAKWTLNQYTVTFNINSGSGTVPTAQTANTGSSITLPDGDGLSRTNYTFGGWNTNTAGTGTNYNASSSYTVTGTVTLYARWITTYTVTFNINSGSGTTPSAQTATTGSSITLPNGSGLSRTGYTFGGWNTNSSGTGTNYEADSSYTVTGTVTLYAKWNVVYTVRFSINSGSGTTPSAQTATTGSSITLPNGSGLSRTNYTFGGWNTGMDGTGTNYEADSSYTVTGTVILYAKWNPISYTVTFNINNGSGTVPPAQTEKYNYSITLPSRSGLSKTGYTFGGWNTGMDGTGTNYDASSFYTVTGTITLYARWYIPIPVEMIWVPGGSFQMGKDLGEPFGDETPVQTVTLTGFYMGKYEVTQAQYQAVTGNNPSYYVSGGNNLPVECVSWYDAVEFCNKLSEEQGLTPYYTINKTTGSDPNNRSSLDRYKWLVTRNAAANGYRLPTEAQWEYAAKGGNGSSGSYVYAGSNTVGNVAWYMGNSSTTHEVGTKAANSLGLYDMSGNVAEWCWDWYGNYSSSAQTDPTGESSGSSRVLRGGGFGYSAEYARSTWRYASTPSYQSPSEGFRLARP